MTGPAHARALVLASGDAGGAEEAPRPEILASWLRSRQRGVDPSCPLRSVDAQPAAGSRLARAALPAVDAVADDLAMSSAALLIADASGKVLHRTTTNDDYGSLLDAAGLVVGLDLAEQVVGTNPIGTALATQGVAVVSGSEHYHDRFQHLAGVAMPVHDPVSGTLLGAVGLVVPAGRTRPAHVALVRQTALLTEQRMLGLDTEAHQRLLARYLAAARAPGDPVFAVSDQTLHASPDAMRLLAGLSHEDLWPPAYDALSTRPTADLPLSLPSGERVAVRLEAVEVSGVLVGAIGEVLNQTPLLPPQQGGRVLSVPEFTLWSPAARRTATAVRRAAEERVPTVVVGEDGVGKATTVRVVAGRAFPGRNLVHLDPDSAEVDRVALEVRRGSPVLVVDADVLGTDQLVALAEAAASAEGDGWLAMTYLGQPDALGDLAQGLPLRVLSASPLRARPQDIELVLPAMLRRHAGGRELQMTSALVERLRREPWPTNFHGLEAVVAEMARSATSRILDVGDLPEAFGAILRRRLTPMEWMTRSAIVAALQANGGNKELAAEALGMSRASIYRKIKAFGIDVDETTSD